MKLRTPAFFLALWCVLAIAPGTIVTVVLSKHSEDVPGYLTPVWIGGWLLQFGVFMLLAVKTPRANSFVGWIVASIVPWLAVWSAPAAPWSLLPCAAALVGYSWWLYRSVTRSRSIQHDGIRAQGVVVKVAKPTMNVVINNVYVRRTLVLRIERADGAAPYEAKYQGLFMIDDIPSPGSVLRLRVDPANPSHFETVNDEVEETSSYPQEASPYPDITDQLQRLSEMHRQGDLSDDEFVAAKRRLLHG